MEYGRTIIHVLILCVLMNACGELDRLASHLASIDYQMQAARSARHIDLK